LSIITLLEPDLRLIQRFNTTEVAKRITNRILDEATFGEQHVRDYLRKNLEFTKPISEKIADILFGSKCA
jgi:hypothetical protein